MTRQQRRCRSGRPPTPRRSTAALASLAFVIAACGGDDDTASTATTVSAQTATTQRLATCDGLADRWVEIQQGFLDDLGDAPVADGTASPEVIEAGRRMGLLLLEHGLSLIHISEPTRQ